MFLGDFRPDEHARPRRLHLPAQLPQAVHHHVPPGLVQPVLGDDVVLAFAHGNDRGDLDRLKDAVIVIALDRRQRADHLGVTDAEPDAPAGHVVGLGERDELHAHVLRPLGLQEARGFVVVVARPPVGEIMDHVNAFAFGEIDDGFVERHVVDGAGGGVVRIVQDQHLRLGVQVFHDVADAVEERLVVAHFDVDDVRAGQGYAVYVDREIRIAHDGGVARAHHRQAHVREAFLRADGGDDFLLRVEGNVVHAFVELRQVAAEVEHAG